MESFGFGGPLRGRLEAGDGASRFALQGNLDLGSSGSLLRRLTEISERSPGDLVLDMSAVVFMDSSGLRAMLTVQRALELEGRRLIMVNPSPPVRRLLAITGVEEMFGGA